MVPAPVGHHCPACVAQATATRRPVRSPFGGSIRGVELRMTRGLIVANVILYVLSWQVLLGPALARNFGMLGVAVAVGEWWRLFTAPFLHAGLWHVGLNMLALWILGSVLEPLLGRSRFLTLYLVSALGGAVASYVFNAPTVLSVGASGAVYGLLGAMFVILRRLDRDVSGVVVILGINLVLGFVWAGIDWRAHLGGLVVGSLQALAFAYAPPARRVAIGWGTTAALLVVLAVLVQQRTEQLLAAFPG
jgi:membrane associated rhomboid family serine protease